MPDTTVVPLPIKQTDTFSVGTALLMCELLREQSPAEIAEVEAMIHGIPCAEKIGLMIDKIIGSQNDLPPAA